VFSEKTYKQLLLIGGIASQCAAIATSLAIIAGKTAEVFKTIAGSAADVERWPPWLFWLFPLALFVLGLWLLIKWRTRHSRLLKPDALRLDRDNPEHLVGRVEEISNLLQQCLAKQIIFLEGESGSGKSALVRAGLLPRLKKDETSILPLMLSDLWVDDWERGPSQALRNAIVKSGAFGGHATATSADKNPKHATRPLSTLADVEKELARLSDEQMRTPLIIFDQFDDYQVRNLDRFLPNKTWVDPATLQRHNPFWEMVARLIEGDKLKCLFVTRSDTAAGLASVEFVGPVQALRLDRVPFPYIAELLARLTEGRPEAPVIADPEAGWNRLRDRIVHDISQQDVVLPQQLKILLGGIQGLKRLSVAQYERAGGARGIEALYVEQQITGTSRKVGLEAGQVRAMLVALIDPSNPNKTRSCLKQHLGAVAANATGQTIAGDRLDKTLEELERGEIIRGATDPESGFTVYRLDHDYLTRGVSVAERRANRWHYLLEDGARAFENAGSLATRWKALLSVRTQCRLAWERMRGTHRYGQQRGYALASLGRFVPVVLILVAIGFLWRGYTDWREENDARAQAQEIWSKFELPGTGKFAAYDRDLDAAWMLAGVRDPRLREHFVQHVLSSQEYARRFLRKAGLLVQSLVGIDPGAREQVAKSVDPVLREGRSDVTGIAAVHPSRPR
jgi:hypothetical protein